MTIETQNRKRWLRTVVAIVLVTIALVGGFATWRRVVKEERIGRRHLVENWNQMRLVRIVLEAFAGEDYPAFCRLPTNTIIRTSPEFVAALPPMAKEACTNAFDYRPWTHVETDGIVDYWGNWFNLFITVTNDFRYPETNFWVLRWSNGPNGKNAFNLGYAKGDDVAMEPFSITVDPSPVRQAPAWHPPLR